MDEMLWKLSDYKIGTYLVIQWDNLGIEVGGTIDTFYESNNDFDEEDERYKEFFACAVQIDKIIRNNSKWKLKPKDLIEVSIDNEPSLIALGDGSIIWRKDYKP